MSHFNHFQISKKLEELKRKQTYVLDEVGVFKLTWNHFPNDPSKDYYEFIGVTDETESIFPLSIIKDRNLENVFTEIKLRYPKMNENDWDTYQSLLDASKEASRIRYYANTKKNQKLEDEAMDAFCNFCREKEIRPY